MCTLVKTRHCTFKICAFICKSVLIKWIVKGTKEKNKSTISLHIGDYTQLRQGVGGRWAQSVQSSPKCPRKTRPVAPGSLGWLLRSVPYSSPRKSVSREGRTLPCPFPLRCSLHSAGRVLAPVTLSPCHPSRSLDAQGIPKNVPSE